MKSLALALLFIAGAASGQTPRAPDTDGWPRDDALKGTLGYKRPKADLFAKHEMPSAWPTEGGKKVFGVVALSLCIDQAGVPVRVDVVGSSGSAVLDALARNLSAGQRFFAAERWGRKLAVCGYKVTSNWNVPAAPSTS